MQKVEQLMLAQNEIGKKLATTAAVHAAADETKIQYSP